MTMVVRVLGGKATKTKGCRVERLVVWWVEHRPGRGRDRNTAKGHVGHVGGEGRCSAMGEETRITVSVKGELGVIGVASKVLTGGRNLSGIG